MNLSEPYPRRTWRHHAHSGIPLLLMAATGPLTMARVNFLVVQTNWTPLGAEFRVIWELWAFWVACIREVGLIIGGVGGHGLCWRKCGRKALFLVITSWVPMHLTLSVGEEPSRWHMMESISIASNQWVSSGTLSVLFGFVPYSYLIDDLLKKTACMKAFLLSAGELGQPSILSNFWRRKVHFPTLDPFVHLFRQQNSSILWNRLRKNVMWAS